MSWCRDDAIGWSREHVRSELEDYISGTKRARVREREYVQLDGTEILMFTLTSRNLSLPLPHLFWKLITM